IETAGFTCTVGSPDLNGLESVHGISGPLMLTDVALNDDDELTVNGTKPDLILLNNDLTDGDIPGVQSTNITPPPHMGWYRRRKS
ncbi:MAG: glutamate--cysteine ligase, partial [Candidatus Poseidoniaceae archaeon]